MTTKSDTTELDGSLNVPPGPWFWGIVKFGTIFCVAVWFITQQG